jgi:two-component sensor histidine kinase
MEDRTKSDTKVRFRGWPRFRDFTIKKKLLLIIMIISTVVMVVTCTGFIIIETMSFKRSMVIDLSTFAQVIGHNCSASLIFNDQADARETLGTLKGKRAIIAAFLYAGDGALLADYTRENSHVTEPPPQPPKKDFHLFKEDKLILYQDIIFHGERIGGIYVESDLKGLQAILRRNMGMLAVILVGSFLLAYLLSSVLRKFISEPITDLSRIAQKISRDRNYLVRAEKYGEDELGSLFDAFNEMLEEILKRDNELVGAKQKAENAALKAEKLLISMERINVELEREVSERKAVELELMQHKVKLEQLVEMRTAQLSEANIHLRQEIEEKRRAEENITRALEEKVILLGEIHHRVKNNLQIIASLLEMSRQRARTTEAAEQLSEAHAKIYTMSLIHSQLYQSERFDQVSMERHTRELFSHLSTLYSKDKRIVPKIQIADLRLPVTQAIPCALILNELVSNAFKYAFNGRSEGSLGISMERNADNRISIEIRDDGVGIPENIDIDKTNSLGLKLVRNLVRRQLKGELTIKQEYGTIISISFKIPDWSEPNA